MKTGFTSTSLRPCGIEENVKAAVLSGAAGIEWGSDVHVRTAADARMAKRLCDENGIEIPSYGTYYRIGSGRTDEWRALCENACIMGAKFLRTWLGFAGSADTGEQAYEAIIKDARSCADAAAEYGLTVSNECHPDTFNDTTASALKFLSDVGRKNVMTYYQSWYADEASDREKLLKTFPFVSCVHVSFSELEKFQGPSFRDHSFIERIVKWLKDLDFGGYVMIEFTYDDDPGRLVSDVKRLRELVG